MSSGLAFPATHYTLPSTIAIRPVLRGECNRCSYYIGGCVGGEVAVGVVGAVVGSTKGGKGHEGF